MITNSRHTQSGLFTKKPGGTHVNRAASYIHIITGMRLKFHQKSGNSEFSGISDFQRSYILPEMNRSQSQLSVEL